MSRPARSAAGGPISPRYGRQLRYRSEHAEHAMAIAQQDLLPALRTQPDAGIVANGFSCRQQIQEGVRRTPQHLALLLRSALASNSP